MDFREAKQKKERGYSVNELVDELVETKDKYEQVIIIAINEHREVDISFSTEETSSVIGLLEVVKAILVDEIRD